MSRLAEFRQAGEVVLGARVGCGREVGEGMQIVALARIWLDEVRRGVRANLPPRDLARDAPALVVVVEEQRRAVVVALD